MTYSKFFVPLGAAAVLGAMLPISPGVAADKPAFSGYAADAWASPVKIEIYEPTIPIPADPQLEIELAYSTVESDSGSSQGRASWLWPGDPVGEGLKTFVTQLGLPEQLGEAGYPVQVNAAQPSGEPAQADEPFPGAVMRTSATEGKTVAQVGFSPDAAVGDGTAGDPADGEDGDEGTPGVPGLPGIPALPGLSGTAAGPDALEQFGQAITGSLGRSQPVAAEDPAAPAPGLPPELAALVDVEGYTSSSQTVAKDGKVVSTARSALGDVALLGGVVTLDGLVVTSSSSSDGKTGVPTGKARLGGITIAGQEFSFGPDGFAAAGQNTPLPGLPDQAAQALEQLGVRLVLPQPELTTKKDVATSDLAGLRVEIDTAVLRDQLDALPLDDLVDAVPAEAGQLKSLLQAAAGLSPRIVVTLGNAGSSVDTVQGLKIPTDVPDNDPGDSGDHTGGPSGGGGTPASGSGVPTSSGPAAGSDVPPAASDALDDTALAGSGLPPLYTIPGAILVGGLALGALGGTWLRRAGVLALGGAGSCTHGLDRGLPDLRKAR
jgi:hypothetical protein